jgi:hypothetical protein
MNRLTYIGKDGGFHPTCLDLSSRSLHHFLEQSEDEVGGISTVAVSAKRVPLLIPMVAGSET